MREEWGMNQERFDDLMRALATGRISRRQVLKAAAVASVAAGTLLNQREAEAAQAADLERSYAGIKSNTQVEHEFGGMKAGILTPEEFLAKQFLAKQLAARKEDEANAEPGVADIQRDLLDVVFGIDISKWQGELNWLRIWNEGFRFSGIKVTKGPYPNGT